MNSKPKLLRLRQGHFGLGLQEFIAYINNISPTKDMTLLEIGAYVGASTSMFCDAFKSVVTVDPFLNGYDNGDKASFAVPMSRVHAVFCRITKKYTNHTLIKKTSDDAIKELVNQPTVACFDVVYIDACHKYDQVKRDILNYRDIVKKGGFVTGHDYRLPQKEVIKAVNDIYGKPSVIFKDGSWLVRKDT